MTLPVSPAPNWSDVEGVLQSVGAADVAGHVALEVIIRAVRAVPGFRSLLGEATGERVFVLAPVGVAGGLVVGAVVQLRVRRAGPQRCFVHPDYVRVVS